MPHAVLSPDQTESILARLDGLLATLSSWKPGPENLLVEHLRSARTYLLGAMPEEFLASLEDARQAAQLLENANLARALEGAIEHLQKLAEEPWVPADTWHHVHHKQRTEAPAGVRSALWEFFSPADTSFGVFYPKEHILVTFPSYEQALAAEITLHQNGFRKEETRAFPGTELLRFFSELRAQAGLWGTLMAKLSLALGTEETFVVQDERRAKEGAGFLAIYCPQTHEDSRIREVLLPFHPVAMQRYLATGIESLI